ncbi:MAG: Rrf2 family transcriptional regulator [Alphaproteobacteria bacterium]|jgi:Rrf2 family iron-sulfur cluster assembly transcriptional regulator|nr:Rrf2 family transcriptional regulator [Alphaproteobacteria bacterium]
MRLTSKGRYAVMAMADLAANGGGARAVPLQEVAQRQDISLSYLEQLFARLRRAGLVSGVRGPGGGYRLSRPASAILASDIISAVNEPIKATRCRDGSLKSCQGKAGRCIAHDLWDELGRQISVFLSGVTLEDVVERRVLGRAHPPHGDTACYAAE